MQKQNKNINNKSQWHGYQHGLTFLPEFNSQKAYSQSLTPSLNSADLQIWPRVWLYPNVMFQYLYIWHVLH